MSQEKDYKEQITVIGAGNWGLTLTWLLSRAGKRVLLYTTNQEKAKIIASKHRIEKPLPVSFDPENIIVTADLAQALKDAAVIVICCTSQSMRSVAENLARCINTRTREEAPFVVSAVKGLELHSLNRMSEILEQILPGIKIGVLSGPNLAKEILQGLPTAAVIASKDIKVVGNVQKLLTVPKFRLYSNADVIGVELGGTLKNVIAIAAGGADGLNLGANAKAALLTRGLAEMTRLAVHLGAQPSTMSGLAGMGDLLATCSSPLSRNYHLGMEMAKGKSLQTVLNETNAVIEGITTTEAVCNLGKKLNIDLPIARLVQAFLDGTLTASDAIMTLMSRPLASEF